MAPEVVACIPAKELASAKSRLALPDPERRLVAKRLLFSTVRTVLASSWVHTALVVTGDDELADIATAAGARVVDEGLPRGLNAAVRTVRQAARFASPASWTLTMVADLPHLHAGEVDALVVEALTHAKPVMVPDMDGTGTTALLHTVDRPLPAMFGPDSARRHRDAGYRPAGLTLLGLREDLDRATDTAAHVFRLPNLAATDKLARQPASPAEDTWAVR